MLLHQLNIPSSCAAALTTTSLCSSCLVPFGVPEPGGYWDQDSLLAIGPAAISVLLPCNTQILHRFPAGEDTTNGHSLSASESRLHGVHPSLCWE